VATGNNISSLNTHTVGGQPTTWGRGILVASQAHDITIADNRVETIKQYGLLVSSEGAGRPTDLFIKNNSFRNCCLRSGQVAFINGADRVTLEGNEFGSPGSANDTVLIADWTDLVIKGGVIRGNQDSCRGIKCSDNTAYAGTWYRLTIDGVTFRMTHANYGQAIYLTPSGTPAQTDVSLSGIIIANNTVSQVSAAAYITTDYTDGFCKIVNNTWGEGTAVADGGHGSVRPTYVNNN
jgi:hypothetical protein